jgi:hypothetical protein
MKRWMILPALALIGCTASAEYQSSTVARADRELADELKGLTPGAPVSCINASSTNGPQIIDKDTMLYRSGRTVYRNELPAECRGLEPGNTLIIEVNGGQVCSNDKFRVLEPGQSIPGPYCRLGKFTPYRK